MPSALFQPLPWEPAASHRPLHLRGEQTRSVSVSGDGGCCLATTEKASCPLPTYACAGPDCNPTPASPHSTAVFPRQFSPPTPLLSTPKSDSSSGTALSLPGFPGSNAAPRAPSSSTAEGFLGALVGSLGVEPAVGSGGCRVRGQMQGLLQAQQRGAAGNYGSDSVAVTAATAVYSTVTMALRVG